MLTLRLCTRHATRHAAPAAFPWFADETECGGESLNADGTVTPFGQTEFEVYAALATLLKDAAGTYTLDLLADIRILLSLLADIVASGWFFPPHEHTFKDTLAMLTTEFQPGLARCMRGIRRTRGRAR